ncbi:MAG: hypothetical protein U0X93_06590 [Anaerolineales bacterium]
MTLESFGFVFGVTIRNAGIVAFIFGFAVTAIVLFIRRWDSRHVSEARTMYADYLQETQQRRRQFLRRLDREIKNPLARSSRRVG